MNILLGTAAALLAAIFLLLYILFFRCSAGPSVKPSGGSGVIPQGKLGEGQICPICAARIDYGDTVKSKVFPPSGRSGRLLHISGCKYCLNGERRRVCPVCGAEISPSDYLVGRIWQLPGKPQVQIQGCVNCLVNKRSRKAERLR